MISAYRSHLSVHNSLRPLLSIYRNIQTSIAMASASPSSSSNDKVKTGILMLNMGGPSSLEEVEPFLTRLFTDTDIMKLPFQRYFVCFTRKKVYSQFSRVIYVEFNPNNFILTAPLVLGLLDVVRRKLPQSTRKSEVNHPYWIGHVNREKNWSNFWTLKDLNLLLTSSMLAFDTLDRCWMKRWIK